MKVKHGHIKLYIYPSLYTFSFCRVFADDISATDMMVGLSIHIYTLLSECANATWRWSENVDVILVRERAISISYLCISISLSLNNDLLSPMSSYAICFSDSRSLKVAVRLTSTRSITHVCSTNSIAESPFTLQTSFCTRCVSDPEPTKRLCRYVSLPALNERRIDLLHSSAGAKTISAATHTHTQ